MCVWAEGISVVNGNIPKSTNFRNFHEHIRKLEVLTAILAVQPQPHEDLSVVQSYGSSKGGLRSN